MRPTSKSVQWPRARCFGEEPFFQEGGGLASAMGAGVCVRSGFSTSGPHLRCDVKCGRMTSEIGFDSFLVVVASCGCLFSGLTLCFFVYLIFMVEQDSNLLKPYFA